MKDFETAGLSEETRLRLFQLHEIPPPTGMALEALRLVGDEQVDLEQLARLIEKSPELTARILRCANAAYYGQRRHVHSVREAVIRVLGLSVTQGLILALSLAKSFKITACPAFHGDRHWFVAIVTGILARDLAGHLQTREKVPPSVAYTAGLMHNLGLLALVHAFPHEMNAALSRTGQAAVLECMQARLGMDHCLAGGWLARRWGLPDELVIAARHHGTADYVGEHWPLARLTGGAAEIADRLFAGDPARSLPAAWGGNLVAAADCEAAVRAVREQTEALKSLAWQLAGNGA